MTRAPGPSAAPTGSAAPRARTPLVQRPGSAPSAQPREGRPRGRPGPESGTATTSKKNGTPGRETQLIAHEIWAERPDGTTVETGDAPDAGAELDDDIQL